MKQAIDLSGVGRGFDDEKHKFQLLMLIAALKSVLADSVYL